MITTDALKYLPQMGLDPSCVFGCASIQNLFDFFGPRHSPISKCPPA
jgi:hypothetical protein